MPREAWVLVKAVVSDTYPDNALPGPQPPFPGTQPPLHPGWPTVPGWPGGSLPGGGSGFPHPSHPIYNPAYPDNTLPQPPLGTWGGGNVPFPTPPIYIPITPPLESGLEPTHPIYIPVYPSQGPGFPTNPIANPGDPNNPGGAAKLEIMKKVKAAVDFWTGNLPKPPGETPTPV